MGPYSPGGGANPIELARSRELLYALEMRSAVVFGATGLVGRHVVDALLDHPEYDRVLVVVRRSFDRSHPKLSARIVDYEHLNDTALPSSDDVFVCLGTTIKAAGSKERFYRVDHDYAVDAARVARASGATRLALVSSVGADASSRNFYLRVKGETERDIGSVAGWSTLELFRPSLLLGVRAEARLGERVGSLLAKPLAGLMVGRLDPYHPIEAKDVARGMIGAIAAGERGTNVRTHRDIARWARLADETLLAARSISSR